jgi:uncharacterized protein (TIGR03083 family)
MSSGTARRPTPVSRISRETWPLVHAARAALAADLARLGNAQWSAPSLCAGLGVREVVAHLTAAGSLNGVRWLAGVIRCRFDFDRQVAMRLSEQLGSCAAETLARFERVVDSTTSPPLPVLALLGEVVVHGEDIRHPLGIAHDHPLDVLTRVARYYAASDQVVPARRHVRGLHLQATDGPFTTGSGPLVTGRTLALVMAMTGRRVFCDELAGDGVATLRARS